MKWLLTLCPLLCLSGTASAQEMPNILILLVDDMGKWHQGMSSKAEADGTLKMTPVDFGFDYYFGFDAPEQGPYAWIENKRFVMNVDAMIGQVMATLDKLKLKDNTLVIFSSDNGPVWYPQDIAKFGHRAAGPWNGLKGALTDAGHHMPFIASWPGKIPAGSSCGELICFTDMLATVASLLGEKLPIDAGEATNVFAQQPDKAKVLFAALKADIARGRSRP